jgi:hypothetical protein
MSARSAAAPDSVHSAHRSSLSLEFRHGWPLSLSLCTGGPGRHADTFLYSYQWWVGRGGVSSVEEKEEGGVGHQSAWVEALKLGRK